MATVDAGEATVEIDVERGIFRGSRLGLHGLWSYRELFVALILRDIKARYKQTLIGMAWAILQPALMMVVFTIFLGRMSQGGEGDVPYPAYVYSGLLAWTLFSTGLIGASQSVVAAEAVITKTYFPRLLLPWAAVGASTVDFCVACLGLIVVMLWYGIAPTWQILWVLPCVILVVANAGGVGSLFAALNVQYRDFRYLIPFLVQIWMFSTPILFLRAEVLAPESAANQALSLRSLLVAINPMNGLIGFFRAAVLGGPLPWSQVGLAAILVLLVVLFGGWYHRRVEHSFADVI